MIDVEKIVKEASATGTCFAPQYHEQRIARHAVALTLRAVAGDLRNSQKDARPLASPHVQIVVKLVDGIADLYESKAAAIEKGGG